MNVKRFLLPFVMVPLLSFGQTGKTDFRKAKNEVNPITAKYANQKSISQAVSKSPAAFCTPTLDCEDNDVITNVTFAGINNTTTCSAGGYGDYTSQQALVDPGQSYPISVTVGDGWFERVSVFIDFDGNGTFDSSDFIGEVGQGSSSGETLTGTISIPATVASGSYRLRVMVNATGSDNPATTDPCDESAGYGESEDYTLVVTAPQGCLAASNGQWPSSTFNPACNGGTETITSAAYLNEFSKVSLTGGTTYTFSTSNSTYFITIGDDGGNNILASGTGTVTYTPTTSGVVRFYSHLSSNCDGGSSIHSRQITCGTPPTEPEYGCEQTFAGVPELANNIATGSNGSLFRVANDFFVPKNSGTFKLSNVKVDMVPLQGDSDMTSFDVYIMEDNGSKAPGNVIKTYTGKIPTSVTQLPDTFANYNTYQVELDLENYEIPVDNTTDKRYWIGLHATSASTSGIFWIGYIYTDGWNTQYNYQSTDDGTTYAPITSTDYPGKHFDSQMILTAACATTGVTEITRKQVAYYPNPVTDFLNISSKQKIESVQVYNVSGQKMSVSAKVVNDRIDMSKLAPGVYIININLDGNQKESFKVIKK